MFLYNGRQVDVAKDGMPDGTSPSVAGGGYPTSSSTSPSSLAQVRDVCAAAAQLGQQQRHQHQQQQQQYTSDEGSYGGGGGAYESGYGGDDDGDYDDYSDESETFVPQERQEFAMWEEAGGDEGEAGSAGAAGGGGGGGGGFVGGIVDDLMSMEPPATPSNTRDVWTGVESFLHSNGPRYVFHGADVGQTGARGGGEGGR